MGEPLKHCATYHRLGLGHECNGLVSVLSSEGLDQHHLFRSLHLVEFGAVSVKKNMKKKG